MGDDVVFVLSFDSSRNGLFDEIEALGGRGGRPLQFFVDERGEVVGHGGRR